MLRTQALLGNLNRVFDKDPQQFLALKFQYVKTNMNWTVADGILSADVQAGPGADFTVDLSQYTLATLAGFISSQKGYNVSYIDPSRANLSALVLLDGSGDQTVVGGDHLYGYDAPLWAYMETAASELDTTEAAIGQALQQINIFNADGSPGAAGNWLDEVGGYFGVTRLPGELDAAYGPRIPAEVLRPRSNNVAMEIAIQQITGEVVTVTDYVQSGFIANLYNGAHTHNGSVTHSATGGFFYGLFDITYTLTMGEDPATFEATVRSIVDRLRSAGTHLHAIGPA